MDVVMSKIGKIVPNVGLKDLEVLKKGLTSAFGSGRIRG